MLESLSSEEDFTIGEFRLAFITRFPESKSWDKGDYLKYFYEMCNAGLISKTGQRRRSKVANGHAPSFRITPVAEEN
jgi:hypothetical protein